MLDRIIVPDRYEMLARNVDRASMPTIVERVQDTLKLFEMTFRRMQTADKGAFLVLRGNSGSGKSTFLHTLKYFKAGIETISVPRSAKIGNFLEGDSTEADLRVFVLEEREAPISFSDVDFETWLHEINGFLRSKKGANALIIWPCNTDELEHRIIALASRIGGQALLGPDGGVAKFSGPPREKYRKIAETTLALTNNGASPADLGLSEALMIDAEKRSELIGDFFPTFSIQ